MRMIPPDGFTLKVIGGVLLLGGSIIVCCELDWYGSFSSIRLPLMPLGVIAIAIGEWLGRRGKRKAH